MHFLYLVGPGPKPDLRVSLRSVHDHFKVDSVTVVGSRPDWLTDINYIPANSRSWTRYGRTWRNMLEAVKSDDCPERFAYFNDDFFCLRRTNIPCWHKGPFNEVVPPRRNRKEGGHRHGLAQTAWLLTKWGHDAPMNYELHVPMMVDRDDMRQVLEAGWKAAIEPLQFRSLYANSVGAGGPERADVKITGTDVSWPDGDAWVSTNDRAFADGQVGRDLRDLYPDPCPHERD